jgi:hypothetical protein
VAKRKLLPRKIRPELMVNARELENVVFVCQCDGRIEVNPGGGIKDGATCPQCGRRRAPRLRAVRCRL